MIRFGSVCSGIEAASVAWHPRTRDLSGLRLGRLMVSAPSRRDRDGHVMWRCFCDCGSIKDIASNSLTRKSPVQSCGCMNATAAQAKRKIDGPWNEGKSYAINSGEHCYKTRHAWAKAVIRKCGNKCQICGWSEARCDVHHKTAKSEGGAHTINNAIVLCPNCHRVHHERGAL
jgi:hypothetical protein